MVLEQTEAYEVQFIFSSVPDSENLELGDAESVLTQNVKAADPVEACLLAVSMAAAGLLCGAIVTCVKSGQEVYVPFELDYQSLTVKFPEDWAYVVTDKATLRLAVRSDNCV